MLPRTLRVCKFIPDYFLTKMGNSYTLFFSVMGLLTSFDMKNMCLSKTDFIPNPPEPSVDFHNLSANLLHYKDWLSHL